MSRKVSLVFSSSPPGVLFPGIVPRVNERRTGCFMPTRLSGGRVANPEGCPENPLRERLTKDPGGPGSNCGSAARDGRSRSRPCRREGSGWVQDPCRLGPWAPAPGWHVTQRCGRRRDSVLPPPLSSRDPRSPARSLDCLISRIFHHLELGWPPRRAQGRLRVGPAGGCIAFQQIVGLSDLLGLRLPPTPPSRARGRSKG